MFSKSKFEELSLSYGWRDWHSSQPSLGEKKKDNKKGISKRKATASTTINKYKNDYVSHNKTTVFNKKYLFPDK